MVSGVSGEGFGWTSSTLSILSGGSEINGHPTIISHFIGSENINIEAQPGTYNEGLLRGASEDTKADHRLLWLVTNESISCEPKQAYNAKFVGFLWVSKFGHMKRKSMMTSLGQMLAALQL